DRLRHAGDPLRDGRDRVSGRVCSVEHQVGGEEEGGEQHVAGILGGVSYRASPRELPLLQRLVEGGAPDRLDLVVIEPDALTPTADVETHAAEGFDVHGPVAVRAVQHIRSTTRRTALVASLEGGVTGLTERGRELRART